MSLDFRTLITAKRIDKTSVEGRNLAEELASDRARILYSAPFRRLTQKTQVFPLESNASIRNRAIHSLEVSDVGRWIAYYVTESLIKSEKIERDLQLPILYAVENACLLHDIGNPPFGHFGESAIREWFKQEWFDICKEACGYNRQRKNFEKLVEDFKNFDGNPQGLRIILRLQTDLDEFSLNLTYTTILSCIKYIVSSSGIEEGEKNPFKKKAGFFESEKEDIAKIKKDLGLSDKARHPLAYIMEAADDISYCISDIEDGIEKNILSVEDFFYDLDMEWEKQKQSKEDSFPFCNIPNLNLTNKNFEIKDFLEFKTSYVRGAIKKASDSFIDNLDSLCKGTIYSLFPKDSPEHIAIECIKSVARRKLYRSSLAENPELAGHEIVTGLLNSFKPLMKLSEEDFQTLLDSRETPSVRYGKDLDLHWRLFNKLPEKHLKAYAYQVNKIKGKGHEKALSEWYHRVHLIIDYISGMTDRFALDQYQLLKGMKVHD